MRRAGLTSWVFAGLAAGWGPASDDVSTLGHSSQAVTGVPGGTGAAVSIIADGQTDAYALFNAALVNPGSSSSAVETPDCLHPAFGPHITQAPDADLGKSVFV